MALLFKDIFAEPSKDTPAIVLAVVKVAADPVVFWFNVATLAAAIVPEEILLPDSSLVYSLIQVESRGNDSCVGDRHLIVPSIGCLQIRPIMVREVNRILKYQDSTLKFKYKDRWSRKKSIQMFYIWKDFHHLNSSDEKIARNWNGGPKGYKRKRTLQYWEKVQKELKHETNNNTSRPSK